MNIIIRISFFISALLASGLCGAALYLLNHHTVDFSSLTKPQEGLPSILLDDAGVEWARFTIDRRDPISLRDMPAHVANAFIAAEDWQFFSHPGISIRGIIRSCLINVWRGKRVQGASTITQQLVKLLFFDGRKTFKRKIKEQLYALFMERQCTKEQILQTYLNNVYFGCGIYGVEAASQRFWSIPARDLSVAQAATLAGIIKCPGQYCPLLWPQCAQQRRNIILQSMHKLAFMSDKDYEHARATPLEIVHSDTVLFAPHAKEWIRLFLEEQIGKQALYSGGLRIHTTLNKEMQLQAQKSFDDHMKHLHKTFMPEIDGALLCLEGKSGHIKALIGGSDFSKSKFNRAMQTHRQIGSVFKPIVYAAAMQEGRSFADTMIDEPLSIEENGTVWQPRNYHKKFEGQMTLAYALSTSNNIVAIKLLREIGARKIAELARTFQFSKPIHAYPSLALGCVDVRVDEVAAMFNIFAHNGIYTKPTLVTVVKDSWGTKIWKAPEQQITVLSPIVTSKVAKALELGVKRWKSHYGQEVLDQPIISKTGTTNDCRTCWFAGATPDYTTVVYIGADDNRSLGDVYPVKMAYPIWLGLHKTLPTLTKDFSYSLDLKKITVNARSGWRVFFTDPEALEILV